MKDFLNSSKPNKEFSVQIVFVRNIFEANEPIYISMNTDEDDADNNKKGRPIGYIDYRYRPVKEASECNPYLGNYLHLIPNYLLKNIYVMVWH